MLTTKLPYHDLLQRFSLGQLELAEKLIRLPASPYRTDPYDCLPGVASLNDEAVAALNDIASELRWRPSYESVRAWAKHALKIRHELKVLVENQPARTMRRTKWPTPMRRTRWPNRT